MIAGRCDRCGGPHAAGQTFCQWCGESLTGRPAVPANSVPGAARPSAASLLPPTFGDHWRKSMVVVACTVTFLVVLSLVVLIVGPGDLPPPVGLDSVHVTEVVASSPDNACGLNGSNGGPFTFNGSQYYRLIWVVPANGSTALPCTVSTISTTTVGFGIVAALPFTATSAMTNLSIDLYTPPSYSGPLNITFD